MKKVLAFLLVAALALSFAVMASADTPAATTATASDNVEFNADDVAKLTDGKTDEAVVFTNKTDDAATVEISFDLGEAKTLSAVDFTCAADAKPSTLDVFVSLDGKDYYSVTSEEGSCKVDASAEAVTTNFAARIAVNARYVKAKVTFTGKTLSISEIGVTTAAAETKNFDPNHAFGYTVDGTASGTFYTAVFTEPGDYTLNGGDHPKAFTGCQITIATWDDTAKAYKIRFNESNTWDAATSSSKHATDTVTLAENEILLAIGTQGNINKENEDDTTYAAAKWLMRGMKEGDWIVLDTDAKTYQLFPAAHEFTGTDTPSSSEPTSSEPTSSEPTSSEPTSSEPTSSEPAASEPTSSEPTASEPTSSEPTASEPASSAPASSAPASSAPASSSSPAAGDSGMLVFAVLGVLSVAGVAVALKVRH